jgi:hypothetical protein
MIINYYPKTKIINHSSLKIIKIIIMNCSIILSQHSKNVGVFIVSLYWVCYRIVDL